MTLEVIGVLAFLLGLLMLARGPAFGAYALAATSILGAAAAVQLPSLGDASVPPAMIILPFFAVTIARHAHLRSAALASLTFPRAGFWFLLVVVFAILSAVFLPRIFGGMSYVYSLARNDDAVRIVTLPLAPRASNATQTLYLVADLICFAAVAAYVRRGGARTIAGAVLFAAALHLFFALADIVTYATQTQEVLSVIRNANYRMLNEGEIGGFKRIVGSFTEAGAYSYAAIGFYGFALSLWLDNHQPRATGTIAALLLLVLALSTSSMAYATLAAFSIIVLAGCVRRMLTREASRQQIAYACVVPILLLLALAGAMLVPAAWTTLSGLFDATIANKLATQSGIERLRWNHQALVAFFDTLGAGAGVGSVRASSFVVAVLANCGVLGCLLFAAFLVAVIIPERPSVPQCAENRIARAGAHACLALLIAASISAAGVDLGLFFSIFAAASANSRGLYSASNRPLLSENRDSSLGRLAPAGALP